ncbi:LPS-assembly protein LptD [Sphingomonas bacterium]|uniref:LPS-assembly protein LptD n=1 Tax=Sphingomonas bacterium TaxID=1895847 RepID=UPI0020C6C688|nr:LPS assembly protein LptD [Sphingomonas bacterium]
MAAPAFGQELQTPAVAPPASGAAGLPASGIEDQVNFAADALDYDDDADIVTATGDVRMLRGGSRLRADRIVWNRKTGQVTATGNVASINSAGDTAYGDSAVLGNDMKNGIVENMLLVLADGGRLAARHGVRKDNVETLDHAAYTPCRVTGDDGCPKKPSWQITALRIVHDGNKHRIFYKDARFNLFGVPILWLPAFSHPDGSQQGGGGSGLLLPNFQYSRTTGAELELPYYRTLGPNRDITITPHLFSAVLPALEVDYRQLDTKGAFETHGMITYGSRLPAVLTNESLDRNRAIRGYIDAHGTYQFGPYWTLSGELRGETDKTFMRRYAISNDDRLRSTIELDRIDGDSYLSIAGWFVQTVRASERQRQQPIALPAIDYRRRIGDPLLGGVVQLQLNSLALTRTGGQDTQRAFALARWDLRKLTPLGQEITFTALARADVYHTDQVGQTSTVAYRGLPGWQGRGIAAAAADMRWPLIGSLWGGTQQIIPRVQFVATPPTRNLAIPDEDSRAVDLEDTNLFAINRFSGYDRWEDGSRVTYGAEWNFQRPRLDAHAELGQSYRLTTEPSILPEGTGLSGRFSDYVGRVTVKYGSWIEVTERFRLDKNTLSLHRNEIDATFGTKRTYLLVGYLLLDRDIDPSLEDLRDRQELRLGGRLQITRYWSVYGSTVIDLTTRSQDPRSTSDGFQPVRERLGLTYENECISLGISWRRDYDPIGDARRGNTFSFRLALKNIGR